jgi:hypothetical protein
MAGILRYAANQLRSTEALQILHFGLVMRYPGVSLFGLWLRRSRGRTIGPDVRL